MKRRERMQTDRCAARGLHDRRGVERRDERHRQVQPRRDRHDRFEPRRERAAQTREQHVAALGLMHVPPMARKMAVEHEVGERRLREHAAPEVHSWSMPYGGFDPLRRRNSIQLER